MNKSDCLQNVFLNLRTTFNPLPPGCNWHFRVIRHLTTLQLSACLELYYKGSPFSKSQFTDFAVDNFACNLDMAPVQHFVSRESKRRVLFLSYKSSSYTEVC